MDAESFRRFTDDLRVRLASDARVLGLVALGSMAERDYGPDRWSDHDFFVIVAPGSAEAFRSNLSWLPVRGDIVFVLRETAHGLKVLYRDAHLLELAVFEPGDVALAKADRARVLLDRGGVAEAIEAVTRHGDSGAVEPDLRYELGMLVSDLLVGFGRYRRGEWLSAHERIAGQAVGHLLRATALLPAPHRSLLDALDPRRRFERVHPALGTELRSLVSSPVPEMARGLLAVARREVGDLAPADVVDAMDVVDEVLRAP